MLTTHPLETSVFFLAGFYLVMLICGEVRKLRNERRKAAAEAKEQAKREAAVALTRRAANQFRSAVSMGPLCKAIIHAVLIRTDQDADHSAACDRIALELIGQVRGNRPDDAPLTPDDQHRLLDAVIRWSHEQTEAHLVA